MLSSVLCRRVCTETFFFFTVPGANRDALRQASPTVHRFGRAPGVGHRIPSQTVHRSFVAGLESHGMYPGSQVLQHRHVANGGLRPSASGPAGSPRCASLDASSCRKCGKTFAYRQNMMRHRYKCEGTFYLQCRFCGRNFNRRDYYSIHLMTRHNVVDQK